MRTAKVLGATLALALVANLAASAQAGDAKLLREKDAKKILKHSQESLEQARKASQRGDAAAARAHLEQYSQNLAGVNQALARGQVRERDVLAVADRVDEATLKHVAVLEGLLGSVPEQARPAIERALQVSRHGHDAATEAILNHGQVSLPGGVLDDQAARTAMEKNGALVEHARRAREWRDPAALRQSVERYTGNLDAVTRAIESGAVDEAEAVSVLDRVDHNTRRHLDVLEGLLGQVPEQARPGIERAIQASQRGNQAAVEAISRTPAAGHSAGRPGGVAGGPGAAPSGQPDRRPGGGPPSGRPGGGPPH